MATQTDIQNALKAVKYPGYSRDIVSFGLVKEISIANGAVSVTIQLTTANPEAAEQIKTEAGRVLKALPGVNQIHVEVRLAREAMISDCDALRAARREIAFSNGWDKKVEQMSGIVEKDFK